MPFLFDWSDVTHPARREILFADRNRDYGAYLLRKNYCKNIILSFSITISFIVLLILLPVISRIFREKLKSHRAQTEVVLLEEPPPIDKYAPPPVPPITPPPVKHTIKFTPPVIVEDKEAEDPPPTQEETKNTAVAVVNQEGEDLVDLPGDLESNVQEEKVFTIVEEMPMFPGGDKKLLQMLARINYPVVARENGIAGSVYLTFIVEKDGKIKDAKVLKGIGGGCDEEALRVLKSLPDWIPGKQNGRPVAVRSSVRVNFTLQ